MTDYNLEELIQQNHDTIEAVANYFASRNNCSVSDKDDYYQEGCITLINIIKDKSYDPSKSEFSTFLSTVMRRKLAKIANVNNSILTARPGAIKLCTEIYALSRNGMSSEDIENKLGITHSRYLQVLNLLNRESHEGCINNDNSDIKETIEHLKFYLNKEESEIFDLCLREKSIEYIGDNFNRSREWARIKILNLLEKLKRIYNDQ